MKYVVKMDLGAMIYVPSFLTSGSGIQKLMCGGGGGEISRHAHSMVIS
jgi:hypothetical protein